MDIQKIMQEYDDLMAKDEVKAGEKLLLDAIDSDEATVEGKISLNNELIGYYRNVIRIDDCLKRCELQMQWLNEMGEIDVINGGAILINLANAFRACDKQEESLEIFEKVEELYNGQLDEGDYLMVSLYNNMSLLHMNMEHYDDAISYSSKALMGIRSLDGHRREEAVTLHNMANIYQSMEKIDEAEKAIDEAIDILKELGDDDSYAGAMMLNTKGNLCYEKGNSNEAIDYLEKVVAMLEKHTGQSPVYEQAVRNMEFIKEQSKA